MKPGGLDSRIRDVEAFWYKAEFTIIFLCAIVFDCVDYFDKIDETPSKRYGYPFYKIRANTPGT